MSPTTRPDLSGSPFPLGASVVDNGVSFAVHAPDADGVEICLVDGLDERRVELTERTYGIWHGVVEDAGVGTAYGIRASGPWNPEPDTGSTRTSCSSIRRAADHRAAR